MTILHFLRTAHVVVEEYSGCVAFYFYCVAPKPADGSAYEHLAIALAEGFESLGVPFFANIDTWYRAPGEAPLFRHDAAVDPRRCAAVFFTEDWFFAGNFLPSWANDGTPRPLLVYLDRQDGGSILSLRPEFRTFDFVLRASYQKNARYPSNFEPWAFGLTQRIIDATADAPEFSARRRQILVSYRHSKYPHSVRQYVESKVLPRLAATAPREQYAESAPGTPGDANVALLQRQTSGRHSPAYFAALGDSMACASFGGFFVSRFARNPASYATKVSRRLFARMHLPSRQLLQWDSWRLWESFAAACVTLHLDFEKYGCVLPEMPVNWKHYAGIDLDNVPASAERFGATMQAGSQLGAAGRVWALEHYGPCAVARRFLALLEHRGRLPAGSASDALQRAR